MKQLSEAWGQCAQPALPSVFLITLLVLSFLSTSVSPREALPGPSSPAPISEIALGFASLPR